MKKKFQPDILSVDQPLSSIKQDELDVANFASNISDAIIAFQDAEQKGLVIGLDGAWGSGKTTFINFIRYYIEEEQKQEKHPEKKLLIIDFNPWLFSGHNELIQTYLIELAKNLSPHIYKTKKFLKETAENSKDFLEVAQAIGTYAGMLLGISPVITSMLSLFRNPIKKLLQEKPLLDQKKKIDKLLIKSKRKILVIIDDLDRLDPQEIMDMFKMVKSVADFSNVTYLLSFDRNVVKTIIKNSQNLDADLYLEKIIQYKIKLPAPNPNDILKYLKGKLAYTKELANLTQKDQSRLEELLWGRSLIEGNYLKRKIKTLRQVNILSNSFNVEYPPLLGEVNFADFLGIEALKAFDRDIFIEIRENQPRFITLSESDPHEGDREYFDNLLNYVKGDNEDKESVKDILSFLFPRVKRAYVGTPTYLGSELDLKTSIGSSYHFSKYFTYTIPSKEFSEADFQDLISQTKKRQDFGEYLNTLIKDNPRKDIRQLLGRFYPEIQSRRIEPYDIIGAFLVLDKYIVLEQYEEIIADIIECILKNFISKDLPLDFNFIKEAYKEAKNFYYPLNILFSLEGQNVDNGFLKLEQIKELEKIILPKIQAAANDGSLIKTSPYDFPLWTLKKWTEISGSKEGPSAFIKQLSTTISGIKEIKRIFRDWTNDKLEIKELKEFVEISFLHPQVKKILSNSELDPKDRNSLEEILQNLKDEP